ncbi:MAG: hypothetical protein J5840_06860 [Lachnospiraceae bacterium]|nr:hypothetical protein [Lachnospiraceae bacterium]
MAYDITCLIDAGLDTKAGLDYTGGEEKYISAVQRYYKNYEKNKAKVEEYYSNKDFESYMITVHALKSNSRMIGAMDLGKEFEYLENAARERDYPVMASKTLDTLKNYEELIKKLSPIGQMDKVSAAGEISAEVAKATADELLVALDDFDDELSKKLAAKLSGYPFRITQRDRLQDAIGLIDDFMYDEAAEIIKEIYPSIE